MNISIRTSISRLNSFSHIPSITSHRQHLSTTINQQQQRQAISNTMSPIMKEALVNPDLSVNVRERAVPTPGKDQVLIKVEAFGLNPKDWKFPEWQNKVFNAGDDVAGYVEAVGEGVFQFAKGDRVAGYRWFHDPNGAFAEYAIVPSYAVFRLPESTSFEEAATIPLVAITSLYGLYDILKLPNPWQVKEDTITRTPLIVYGASTAVGAFGIKLASLSNIHPIIAVGSASSSFVTDKYLDPSKGDALVDYKKYDSQEKLAAAIKQALIDAGVKDGRAYHALDGVSEGGSYDKVLAVAMGGDDTGASSQTGTRPTVATVLPTPESINGVDLIRVDAKNIHQTGVTGRSFSAVWFAIIARALQEGSFTPHPYDIIPEGYNGLSEALKSLKAGKVHAKKLVGRFRDTPSL